MMTNKSNQPEKDDKLSEREKQDYKIYTEKLAKSETKQDMESGHDLKARQHPYVETEFQTKGESNEEQKGSANVSGQSVPKMNANADEGDEQNKGSEEGDQKINKEIPDDQQAS